MAGPDIRSPAAAAARVGDALARGPRLMAVLNLTPDSFSDGGRLPSPAAAVAHARAQVAAGAGLLDLGAESTRPHAQPVDEETEMARLLPALRAVLAADVGVPVSVDTRRAAVAAAALDAGAAIVNDVDGLRCPDMLALVARRGVTAIAMHARGTPATMDELADYADVTAEVVEALAATARRALAAGVAAERLWLDPGLGFAKTAAQSLALLAGLPALVALGHPVVVGPSRKRFLGAATGRPAGDRDRATAAACALAAFGGAAVLRVHDVAAARDAVAVGAATRAAGLAGVEGARPTGPSGAAPGKP